MQRPRAPPPPPPALPPSGRSLRRSLTSLAPQWSIDHHHQLRASMIALTTMAAPPALLPPSPTSTAATACCSGSSRRRKRVSIDSGRPSSPSERSTNDSLSSTQLTATSSDLLEMEWDDDDDDTESLDSRRQPPLSDWIYWQRDAVNLPDCWTRVFAVYKAPQLWLYRYELATPQSLLLRMKVTRVEAGREGARQLKLMDAAAGRDVHICMLDWPSYEEWRLRIRDDVYALADEIMEQRASDSQSHDQNQLVVVTRDRRSSSTSSTSSKHGGVLGRALSTAVTSFKKSHGEPLSFRKHRHKREPLTMGPPATAPPGFATAPASISSVHYKKSGWKTVKSALSGVWKHGAERKQLDI